MGPDVLPVTAKLIVLADPHMVPKGGTIIGVDPYKRLVSAVRHINRHHADASAAIVLGDLTHGGDARSYLRLRRVLERLTVPAILMVGNHDHRPTLLRQLPATVLDEHGYVQSSLDVGGWRLLLLDTLLDGDASAPSDACGQLCSRRLAWLDRRLGEAREKSVIIAMHHPPMAVGFPGIDAVRLLDAEVFLAIVRRHGNVRHILAGHVHRSISGDWHGIPFSVFKSTVHQQPLDLCSRSSSLSVAEPAAYGILLLGPAGAVVHTEDYEIAAWAALDAEWAAEEGN